MYDYYYVLWQQIVVIFVYFLYYVYIAVFLL